MMSPLPDHQQENWLPQNWEQIPVKELLQLQNGFPFKPTQWSTRGLPIIRIQNLNKAGASFNYFEGNVDPKFKVENGDLLFAWSGTPGTSFGAHIWTGGDAWLNQHIFNVKFKRTGLNKEFIRLAINQNLAEYVENANGGVGLAHITKAKFDESLLIVPPLEIQDFIVERVQQFNRLLTPCRERLTSTKSILKKFRQSVLAAACSGQLTADWRDGALEIQPASELLKELAEARSDQIGPKAKQPVEPDLEMQFDIPDSWECVSVDALSTKVADGVHKKPNYVSEGIPFVTVRNLTAGPGISFERLNYVTRKDHLEFTARTKPERGDILISKDGTIGTVRVVDTDREFSIFVSVALVKVTDKRLTRYLELAFNCPAVQERMTRTGTGLQHLVLRDLRQLAIPLPPWLVPRKMTVVEC